MRYIPCAIALILWASSLHAQWPQFRGPHGSGILETTELAVTFGPGENVRWEEAVPAGKSSPIVTDGRLFLTAHEGQSLLVLCFDRLTGRLLWKREIEKGRTEGRNTLNDPASPTSATDGETVYSFFPELGLIAHNLEGRELWRTPLGPFEFASYAVATVESTDNRPSSTNTYLDANTRRRPSGEIANGMFVESGRFIAERRPNVIRVTSGEGRSVRLQKTRAVTPRAATKAAAHRSQG